MVELMGDYWDIEMVAKTDLKLEKRKAVVRAAYLELLKVVYWEERLVAEKADLTVGNLAGQKVYLTDFSAVVSLASLKAVYQVLYEVEYQAVKMVVQKVVKMVVLKAQKMVAWKEYQKAVEMVGLMDDVSVVSKDILKVDGQVVNLGFYMVASCRQF